MSILFVVVCIPFFPSGIVRVERYFNLLHEAGIQYRWVNFNSPRVQRWLEWLDTSWFGKQTLTDLIMRLLIHASGLPHQWLYMLKILMWSKKYDVIHFQSVLLPVWYIHLLSHLNQRIVFDFDDALYIRRQKQTRKMIQSSWKVMAGSQVLVNFARQYNPSAVIMPGSVTIEHYDSSTIEDISEHKTLCIGWIGGSSTLKQLEILVEPITRLVEKGYSLNILIAGSKKNNHPLNRVKGVNIIDIPNYIDIEIPELIKQIDIGVMPLYDYPFEQGKCAFKTIIYMAGKKPIVCSPVGEARLIVKNGHNGYFASSPLEWVARLEELINDRPLRERFGKAGRELIEKKYTDKLVFQILNHEIIQPVLAIKK